MGHVLSGCPTGRTPRKAGVECRRRLQSVFWEQLIVFTSHQLNSRIIAGELAPTSTPLLLPQAKGGSQHTQSRVLHSFPLVTSSLHYKLHPQASNGCFKNSIVRKTPNQNAMATVVAGLFPVGRLTHHGFSPEQVWLLPRFLINHSKQHWGVASQIQNTLQLVPVQVQGVFLTKCHFSTPLSLQQSHSFLLCGAGWIICLT